MPFYLRTQITPLELRYRVVSAGIKGVTASDAPDAHSYAFNQAEFSDSFVGIMRAARRKTAGRRENLRPCNLI
jgi:hypothetical protein